VQERVKGSHAHYKGVVAGQTQLVTVQTNHLNDTVAPGTLQSIIRQSGLSKKDFV
jgi:predicted RNA binding protein YcfA (HicA-like mRNA interferase family)